MPRKIDTSEDITERRIKKAFYTAKEVIQFVVAAVTVVVAIVTFVNTTQRSTARSAANANALDLIRIEFRTSFESLELDYMNKIVEIEINKASNSEMHEEHENMMRRIDNAMDRAASARDLIDGRQGIAERVLLLEERTRQ